MSVHQENALFYQLSSLIYKRNNQLSDFHEDRNNILKSTINPKTFYNHINIMSDVLLYFDFDNVYGIENKVKEVNYEKAASSIFEHGIGLTFNGKSYVYYPFIKSGSMGRAKKLSFIREDYVDELNERLNFDFFDSKSKYQISKVLAYQGLYMSSGVRVDIDDLDSDSVVVVDDYKRKDVTESYTTGISRNIIREKVKNMFFAKDYEEYSHNVSFVHSCCLAKNHPDYKVFTHDYDSQVVFNPNLDFDDPFITEFEETLKKYYKFLYLDTEKNDDELHIVENVNIETYTEMFDGEGLIDLYYTEELNKKYLDLKKPPYHYSLQFRLPYAKGVLHAVDLQKWFNRKNVSKIVDAFGNEKDVSKLKIILTVSQLKCYNWLKSVYEKSCKKG